MASAAKLRVHYERWPEGPKRAQEEDKLLNIVVVRTETTDFLTIGKLRIVI
jgi:hypothetical protein